MKTSGYPIRVLQSVGTMNHGGIEHFIMNVYRKIDREKIQFDFSYRVDKDCVFDEEIQSLGGRIYRFQSPDKHPLESKKYYRALFSSHPEIKVVHEHRTDMSGYLGCLKTAKEVGIAIRIIHSHNSKPAGINSGVGDQLRLTWHCANRKLNNGLATHKMACSDLAADWMFGSGSEALIVNNGIEAEAFKFDELSRRDVREGLCISPDAFVVGSVGRLAFQKNQEYLIRVLKCMPIDRDPHLMIVGDGPLMGSLRRTAEIAGVANRVHFLGIREDVSRLYSAMDVLCMPSLYEGLPVSAVEAQAAGLPVVFSDNVSTFSAVTDQCEFLSLKEPFEFWARKLLRFTSGFERRAEAFETVKRAGFDIEDTVNRLTSIYSGKN